jgi:phosphoribosylformylglycinamidine synthase
METNFASDIDTGSLSLSSEEILSIRQILGREPNALELEIFSILWSEHACYKNSLKWLLTLPRKGERVLVMAGSENAGAIDLGDGLACVLKIESHNHPCAVQPRLGALTGLRVVARDVFAMGATPVAILNSLRFGDDKRDTARWLFHEVIAGLNDFEKGFGVPVTGGELAFNHGYNTSPIVNNMVIGITPKANLLSGIATGKGNLLAILGSPTGPDGIDNDAFAADLISLLETQSISMEQLHDVSVEKKLFKAIQYLTSSQLLVGLQPIGAQGVVGAASEMAARGNCGIQLKLEQIPVREEPMSPRELLLSETWGRILLCFKPSDLETIKKSLLGTHLEFAVIGEVIDGDKLFCEYQQSTVAEIPVAYVGLGGKAPIYERMYHEPSERPLPINVDDLPEPDHYPNVVRAMIKGLNLTSRQWLIDKFDRTLHRESLSHQFPSDATFINIPNSDKSLAATIDCNPNYMKGDPNIGAQIAVAEASRNIVCAGGDPVGIVDCLNFGNPYDPVSYWQFVMAVQGLSKAAEAFKTPVLGGNVSFYNQRSEEGKVVPIIPTPVIGMIGIVNNKKHHTTLSFKQKGDMIFLLGRSRNDVNGSEYLSLIHNTDPQMPPVYHEDEELAIQKAVKGLISNELVRSVHDVSNGGLFFCMLECAIPLEFGFDITSDAEIRKDAFLFGESQSRVVVSVAPGKLDYFVDYLIEMKVPFSILGHVTKGEIRVDDESFGFVSDLKLRFESALKVWAENA